MGKRKTKTGKKKQARASKGRSLTKMFAKKLGISDGNKNNNKPTAMSVDSSGTKKDVVMKFSVIKKKKSKTSKQQARSSEQNEFQREQASLVERELTMSWKRNKTTKRNGRKRTTAIQLEPATFAVSDREKSSEQLVKEVVSQVQNLNGIGVGSSLLRAATATTSWTPAWSAEETPSSSSSNPWAVLDNEAEEEGKLKASAMKTAPSTNNFFQFAPATFSLGTNVDDDL